ncbi:MAG: hypothetical protein DME10_23575 [Candidatus Rokuibacteriota bacterium]|nr:MAG: hypothetical protein DME10_23575 [Candidatus Rokubacteria bacterium]
MPRDAPWPARRVSHRLVQQRRALLPVQLGSARRQRHLEPGRRLGDLVRGIRRHVRGRRLLQLARPSPGRGPTLAHAHGGAPHPEYRRQEGRVVAPPCRPRPVLAHAAPERRGPVTGGGRLRGRVALVTGASRGFGRAIALAFAREGAQVAVNYLASGREADEVVADAGRLGTEAIAIQGDVARENDACSLVKSTLDRFGRLDILVNNAGIMVRGALLQVPADAYQRMFDVNVTGTILCTSHALPSMIENRYGRIINLSTQLAQRAVGGGGFAAYAATKGAIEALTRALASEVGAHGITVNAIAPGGIETDMSKDVMTPEYRTRRLAELPLRRFGSVEDVAYCAVVLAADEAGYLTGQILHPSGGWVSG